MELINSAIRSIDDNFNVMHMVLEINFDFASIH